MGNAPEPEVACRDAIRHWSSLPDLAQFAVERHGYHNTDGGFGVTYPGDLDEYDRRADGLHSPSGYVLVDGFWGPPDGYELLIPETDYLIVLAQALASHGFATEAAQVRALITF